MMNATIIDHHRDSIERTRANLLEYLPGDFSTAAAAVVDSVAELAVLCSALVERHRGREFDERTGRSFLALTDRLARGLWLLGTRRVEGSTAEQLAARAFVAADAVLAKVPAKGRA